MARNLRSVSRLFRDIHMRHQDWVRPPMTQFADDMAHAMEGAFAWLHSNSVAPEEPDDYRCCECGLWTPAYRPLIGLVDPYGYPLSRATVTGARNWLHLTQHCTSPATTAHRPMAQAMVAMWPGDVCQACHEEWPG